MKRYQGLFFYPRKIMDWKRFGYVDEEALLTLWKHIGISDTLQDSLLPADKAVSTRTASNSAGLALGQTNAEEAGNYGKQNSVSVEEPDPAVRSSVPRRSVVEGSQFIRILDECSGSDDKDMGMSAEERCRVPPWLRGRKDVYVDEAGEIGFVRQENGTSSSVQVFDSDVREDDYKAYVVFPRTKSLAAGYGTEDSVGVEGIKVPVASRFQNFSVTDIECSEMWKYAGVVVIADYYRTSLVDYGSIVASVEAGRAPGLKQVPQEALHRVDKFSSLFSRELVRMSVNPSGLSATEAGSAEDIPAVMDKYDRLYTIMLPADRTFVNYTKEEMIERRYQRYIREGLVSRQSNRVEIRASVGKIVRCLCGHLFFQAIKDIHGSLATNINFESTKDPFRRCSRNRGGKLSKGTGRQSPKALHTGHSHGIDDFLQAKGGMGIGYQYGAFRSVNAAPFAQAGCSWDLVQLLGEYSITLYTRASVEGAHESLDAMVSFLCMLGREENASFVPYNSQISASSTFMNPEWHVHVDTALCVADGKDSLETVLGKIKKYVNDQNYAVQDPDPAGTHARYQLVKAAKDRYSTILHDPVKFYRQLSAESSWISKFHTCWKEMDVRDLFATQSLMKLVQLLKNIDFVLFRRDSSTHLPRHLIPKILVKPSEPKLTKEDEDTVETYHDKEYDLLYKESSNIGLSAGWYNCTMPNGVGMQWQLSSEDHSSFTSYCQKLSTIQSKAQVENNQTHSRYEDEEAPIPPNSWITEADKQLYKDYASIGIHQGAEMPGKWFKARQIDVESLLAQHDKRKEEHFSQCVDVGFFNVSADNLDDTARQQKNWGASYELLRHWRNDNDIVYSASTLQNRAQDNLQVYQQYTDKLTL
eukprot:gb/GECG01014563.1/.p1 GENE.gb/GECG01014563.1/~~gb/GECG01014563.1/.p1  ORF type:complete len:870 (+),score=119.33 gb/GECG01014563.1/:1-2610(+)